MRPVYCSVRRKEAQQPRESEEEVVVHYGTIASGIQVMRNAAERDKVCAELCGVLCFEMEVVGLMNSLPCLVIRGTWPTLTRTSGSSRTRRR
jgi:nucleoside phosphorylase